MRKRNYLLPLFTTTIGMVMIAVTWFIVGYNVPKPYTETDLFIIKSYIMGELKITDEPIKLTDKEFRRLDIDGDGEIRSMDYVKIKNKMKGIK